MADFLAIQHVEPEEPGTIERAVRLQGHSVTRAQLIADVLGARVEPGPEPEIGWYPIERTQAGKNDPVLGAAPEQLTAFHWHGDIFELPDDATHLARSAGTEHQAFRYGSAVYGLLFHLEVHRPIIVDMIEAFYEELENPEEDAATIVRQTRHHVEALEEAGEQVFGRRVDRAINA